MDKEKFERLVSRAIESLPEEFLDLLENDDIVVADKPTRSQLRTSGLGRDETLLGLYEGVPRTERGTQYGLVLPDKITIFQQPIEAVCHRDSEITTEIQRVVKHEIAHHFGSSDERLDEIENDED